MNTPTLKTERLILRRFTEKDSGALFLILKDKETNKFLPWYALNSIEETIKFYEARYASQYALSQAYAYAVCLKEDNFPIDYINIDMGEAHDLGYGLRKEFWHRGIVTEAAKAIVKQAKNDGVPYITATHDINNPRSGNVMIKTGMKYCYSYEEQWQPKNIPVIFRTKKGVSYAIAFRLSKKSVNHKHLFLFGFSVLILLNQNGNIIRFLTSFSHRQSREIIEIPRLLPTPTNPCSAVDLSKMIGRSYFRPKKICAIFSENPCILRRYGI